MTTPTPTPSAVRIANPFRRIAAVQGVYFLVTGLWPLFEIDSFQRVTGPKADLWLVYAVGGLVAAIGLTVVVAAVSGRTTYEVAVLATGSALALTLIDVVFVIRGVISGIYLPDAGLEAALIVWWVVTFVGTPRPYMAANNEYPRVPAVRARGNPVAPNGRG